MPHTALATYISCGTKAQTTHVHMTRSPSISPLVMAYLNVNALVSVEELVALALALAAQRHLLYVQCLQGNLDFSNDFTIA